MKKYSLLFLILGIATLLLITQKVILPLVYEVVKSDAFLIQSKDQGSQLPISNSMTDLAFMHCNNYIKSELGEGVSLSFPEKPLNSWSLGNYEYVVNAEINITSAANTATKKYACRIAYENGDDLEGANDFDNWSIEGIDGIDEI
ncbi:hypothetical protein [Methyloglobulus sp.]|uniref:hypothetical protein n=1 Tax=Methyloglobulus sp. TaxID=2518622 RepID=UPI0032B84E3D